MTTKELAGKIYNHINKLNRSSQKWDEWDDKREIDYIASLIEGGGGNSTSEPYITKWRLEVIKEYNPQFGDDRLCQCGHSYYRHFDTYEDMQSCGCKYCGCYDFKLDKSELRQDSLDKLGI